MQAEDTLISQVETVLKQEPVWEPPAGLAARLAVIRPQPSPDAETGYLSAAGYGAALAVAAVVGAYSMAGLYEMVVAAMTSIFVMNARAIGWMCVIAMVITFYLFPSVLSPESDSA
jgi:hypothetical protein